MEHHAQAATARLKMAALARGTNIVKKELGLPETYIPASDGAFTLSDED